MFDVVLRRETRGTSRLLPNWIGNLRGRRGSERRERRSVTEMVRRSARERRSVRDRRRETGRRSVRDRKKLEWNQSYFTA